MILKQREDRAASIATLEALMARPEASRHDTERLRSQIDAIIRGDLSESKAAYVLDVHFGQSARNWAVIHDLRISVDGLSAQIDHLLINRLLEIWVLESKRMAGGIKVLENGECLTFNGKFPVAIESPIEQNRRHVSMLQRLLDSDAVALPRRLGLAIKPKLRSLVLISDGRITRPKAKVAGLDTLIRTELLVRHVEATFDKGNPLDIVKVVGTDTLENFARQLVALHQPIEYDWERRFKLASPKPAQQAAQPAPPVAEPVIEPVAPALATPLAPTLTVAEPPPPPFADAPPASNVAAIPPAKPARPPAGQCDACQAPVSRGVKAYCQSNPDRFGQRILCMPCQGVKAVATG